MASSSRPLTEQIYTQRYGQRGREREGGRETGPISATIVLMVSFPPNQQRVFDSYHIRMEMGTSDRELLVACSHPQLSPLPPMAGVGGVGGVVLWPTCGNIPHSSSRSTLFPAGYQGTRYPSSLCIYIFRESELSTMF